MIKAACLVLMLLASPKPFGVEWGNLQEQASAVAGYRYWYGDVEWGEVIYGGLEDVLGMISELQLYYTNKRLYSAVLILGPAGINERNCVYKYKQVVGVLNKKYGHYKERKEVVDPVIHELLTASVCYPILVGLRTVETMWQNSTFHIEASLFSDERSIYIEVKYTYRRLEKAATAEKMKKSMEKF